MQHKKGHYCLFISTFGSKPGLLADVTAFGAHPSNPARPLQVLGTGCTLKTTFITHVSAQQTNQLANKKTTETADRLQSEPL